MRLIVVALSFLLSSVALAADLAKIDNAWVRLPVPGAMMTAAYFQIRADQPMVLASVRSPQAGEVEIHSMSMKKGVMEMRHLPDGLALTPGKAVTLEPGGLHLMLFDMKQPFKAGDKVSFTLSFKSGKKELGTQTIEAVVKPSH